MTMLLLTFYKLVWAYYIIILMIQIILFSDLYLVQFLNNSAKSFFLYRDMYKR